MYINDEPRKRAAREIRDKDWYQVEIAGRCMAMRMPKMKNAAKWKVIILAAERFSANRKFHSVTSDRRESDPAKRTASRGRRRKMKSASRGKMIEILISSMRDQMTKSYSRQL